MLSFLTRKVDPQKWTLKLGDPAEPAPFFERLHLFMPAGSVLQLVTASVDRRFYDYCVQNEMEAYKQSRKPKPWPLQNVFSFAIEETSLKKLSEAVASLEPSKICNHFYVVKDDELWMNAEEFAFSNGQCEISLTGHIKRKTVETFCRGLGISFRRRVDG